MPRVVLRAPNVALRSTWLTWAVLLAIDLISRAPYLGPRLATPRGLVNYAVAALVLWIVVRLLAALPSSPRPIAFAILVGLPMATQWAMFRSYGQFVEPTDFVVLVRSPRESLQAAGAGADRLGGAAVFALATASVWLLPHTARPLRRSRAAFATLFVVVALAVGASYWRASPSLEHSQPAFCAALVGALSRVTAPSRGAKVIPLPPPNAPPQGKLPNVVLVLGESLAASHLTLYGYERDTSPRLKALADEGKLVVLRDAVVPGPHTRTSIPYIMTGLAGPDPSGKVFAAPTVIEYAKSRGYHTAFVSAQEEAWGALDAMLHRGADVFHSGIEYAPEVDVLKGCDDLVLLERGVLPTLRALPEPFFLVLHMDGNHVPYARHSPPSHKVFAEDGANSIGAYDNTVRVTDEFVARVFVALRERDPDGWMFFTSDHGQALGEGGAFYHRGYQSNVVRDPLLVFPPPAPDAWTLSPDAPVAACDLAPTLLHLMQSAPAEAAPMSCHDLFLPLPANRVRVVTAYTPAFLAEPTLLVLLPNGRRAAYDLGRSTVTLDDGVVRPLDEHPLPLEVAARAGVNGELSGPRPPAGERDP